MQRANLFGFIRNLVDAYDEYMKPACRELGLPLTSLSIVLFLANNPEARTAQDIVRLRGIKANLVSIHVAKLVYDGYLERSSVLGDRRKINLLCTEKAAHIIERGRAYQKSFFDSISKGIPEAEITQLRRSLSHLMDNVATLTPPAEVM